VDFDAVPAGTGTSGSPYNASQMPGLTAIDSTVQPGTHIKCKGTWRTTAGNFGRLLRAGTAARPVVYIFNDPTWGQGYIDGGVQLTPAACTNQANAFGNTNWASMRRASIVGLGGNDIADYLHCAYAGTEREPRYFAGYPQLANNDAFDYLQFAAPASWADVIWKPGSADPTQQSDFVAGTAGNQAVASRPRILLSAANTAMGLAAGTLEAAIDADSAPILVMRIYANKWYTARCRRCDADGTVNTSGLYLTPIIPLAGQACLVAGNATYTSLSDYAYRIFNLAKAIDRAGQYAMNPVDGWMLDWPTAAETLHRSRGNSGLRFGANYIWVHGAQICGMARSVTVSIPEGASNGDSIDVAEDIDSSTIRVQRCHFPGFGSIGRPDNPACYDQTRHAARYYNTYQRSLNGTTILISDAETTDTGAADVRFNYVSRISGGIRCIADHARNVRIEGNFLEHINDIHGNVITLYANKYGCSVKGNLVQDGARPVVSETGSPAYDEVTYGTASCAVEDNYFQASGNGTAGALRFQGSVSERGVSAAGNYLDGGVNNHPAFLTPPAFDTGLNGEVTGNFGVGDTVTAPVWAEGSNTNYTRVSAGGIALIAQINAMTAPPVAYAPLGVGYLAGGWDGES
jgi:hypothetical protein